MKEGDVLEVGDVVQISPELPDCFFNGCFMLVTEVKGWGAQGFIAMPGARGEKPGAAYFRCKWENMERIGHAVWVPPPEDEDVEVDRG